MSTFAVESIQERVDRLEQRFTSATEAAPRTDLFQRELARLGGASGATPLGAANAVDLRGLTATATPLTAGVGLPTVVAGGAHPAASTAIGAAMANRGVPYLWGGTDAVHGFDCSGLVQHAYRMAGVELPRVSRDQARMGVEVPSLDQAQPGDLVAFGQPTVNHIGIYVGNGQMIHAPRTGEVVQVEDIDRPIATIRRVVAPSGAGAVGLASGFAAAPTTGSAGPVSPASLQPLFEAAGARHGIDPGLLAAVAKTESAFDPNAVSPAGAQGLMQFMPGTAAQFGVDPFDPASSIDGAARYLRQLLDDFGSVELALAGYNAGPGNVRKYGGVPPFAETQAYVRKVTSAWRGA